MAKILVVDDDAQVRQLLRRLLTRSGYDVSEAGDGAAAQRIVETEPIDLLITDIIMPEKEGIELITMMRKSRPSLPIIAISGGGHADSEQYLEIARLLGAKRVLGKPFDVDELLTAVAELLPA